MASRGCRSLAAPIFALTMFASGCALFESFDVSAGADAGPDMPADWVVTLDPGVQPTATAIDGSGNILVAGHFKGRVAFDASPRPIELTANGDTDAWVAKYSSTGILMWVRQLGPQSSDSTSVAWIRTIAVTSAETLAVAGNFGGSFLNLFHRCSPAPCDVFLSSLRLDDGTPIWNQCLGDDENLIPPRIAPDGTGGVFLFSGLKHRISPQLATGASISCTGTSECPSGHSNHQDTESTICGCGGTDTYLANFAPTGALNWQQGRGDADDQTPRDLAFASNKIVIAGEHLGSFSLMTDTCSSGECEAGTALNSFVATFLGDGRAFRTSCIAEGAADSAAAVAIGPTENIFLAGYRSGPMHTSRFCGSCVGGFVTVLDSLLVPQSCFCIGDSREATPAMRAESWSNKIRIKAADTGAWITGYTSCPGESPDSSDGAARPLTRIAADGSITALDEIIGDATYHFCGTALDARGNALALTGYAEGYVIIAHRNLSPRSAVPFIAKIYP